MNRKLVLSMVAILFILVGCGAAEADKRDTRRTPAEVELKVPDTAVTEEFWEGVTERRLIWRAFGGAPARELPLTGGEAANVDLSGGGELSFEGRSERGALLVEGLAIVEPWDPASGQRKLILISLHRRG